MNQLSEKYEGQAKIFKLDLDANKSVAKRFGVKSIPAVMFFKKGDKVVCIDDTINNPNIPKDFQNWIKKDDKYTVRETSMDLNGNQGILLNEIKNKKLHSKLLGGYFEPRFASVRFRKMDENDIEIKVEEEIEVTV